MVVLFRFFHTLCLSAVLVFTVSASGLAQNSSLPRFAGSSKPAFGTPVDITTNTHTVRHWDHAFRHRCSNLLWSDFSHGSVYASASGVFQQHNYHTLGGFYAPIPSGFSYIAGFRSQYAHRSLFYAGTLSNSPTSNFYGWMCPISTATCLRIWPGCGPVWWAGANLTPLSFLPTSGLLTLDPCTGRLIPLTSCNLGWGPALAGPVVAPPVIPAAVMRFNNAIVSRTVVIPEPLALIDPRALDQIAPAMEVLPPENMAQNPDPVLPLLDEFPLAPLPQITSTAADRVESLLLQAQGDQAFRRGDYASAKLAFETARQRAPQRAAVWFRLMLVYVALNEPAQAAGCLKTALNQPADGTRAWVSAREIYGSAGADSPEALQHSEQLWGWLSERPMSADRLLLLGTFQKMRGYEGVAADILAMASHKGAEEDRVLAVRQLAAFQLPAPEGIASVPAGRDLFEGVAPVQPVSVELAGRAETTIVKPGVSTGIVLRGKRKSTASVPAVPK